MGLFPGTGGFLDQRPKAQYPIRPRRLDIEGLTDTPLADVDRGEETKRGTALPCGKGFPATQLRFSCELLGE